MFHNLAHARIVITAWATGDNPERPHSALDCQTPADYALTLATAIARSGLREMKAPRAGRLLNLRQPAQKPIGFRLRLDENYVAGQSHL